MHCLGGGYGSMVQDMKHGFPGRVRILLGLVMLVVAPEWAAGEPTPADLASFRSYVNVVESRLAVQHQSRDGFLAHVDEGRLRRGELVVEEITQPGGGALPGAMLHHWRGTAFARGASAAEFERLMRDVSAYPRTFAPQVLQARVTAQRGDRMQAVMRVRQKHVITVVMDTAYDISFGRLDARHGYSISRSTRVSEIASPGSSGEHAMAADEEHGFLWRMNTYWSYEERDGGLYVQVESVSLTRSIPRGLGWVVGPFVESVPRESLEFTLRSVCSALKKQQ